MRREAVALAVAGEEGDTASVELTDGDLVARRTERGVDAHPLDVVEEGVEAGSADHTDVGAGCLGHAGRLTSGAGRSETAGAACGPKVSGPGGVDGQAAPDVVPEPDDELLLEVLEEESEDDDVDVLVEVDVDELLLVEEVVLVEEELLPSPRLSLR